MTREDTSPYAHLAPYYEVLSETRDWDAWLAYVQAVLVTALGEGAHKVLDAACGTGRIASGLSVLGHRVTGVDVSEAMLDQARANARSRGVEVPLYHQDLRRLSLEDTFDAAVCLCDSLNYITDVTELALALCNLAERLRPGGVLLFDVNTDWKLEHLYGDYTYAEHVDNLSYIWENAYDPEQRMVTMHLAFFIHEGGELYRRVDEVHVQRAHGHEEIVACLAGAGLEIVSYGEVLGLQPPEPMQERVFYLVRRPSDS